MPTLGEAVAGNLGRLIERERQSSRAGAPAQYQRADFQRIPGKAGRYTNLQTGAAVSRRQHDKLIGRPLPIRTRQQARARVARQVQRRGLTVKKFSGLIQQPSGRERRTQRDRTMRQETPIEGDALEGLAEGMTSGDAATAGAAFNDAFIEAWWGTVGGEIGDVTELEFMLGEEPDAR